MKENFKLSIIICLVFNLCIGVLSGCNMQSSFNTLNNSKQNESISNFLNNNYSKLNTSDDDNFSSFKLIDESLDNKEVFLTAENHGVIANSKLELKFLKYFKKKANIKYYLQEMSYSDACFINQYLQTGNEKIIEELYKPLKGTFAWNKQGYEKWKEVYEFSKSLPDNEKIKVVGIDIEHQPINALRYMYSIIPKEKVPNELSPIINELEKLLSMQNGNEKDIKDFSIRLKGNISKNKDIYNRYLGDNFFDFNMINENILNKFEAYSYIESQDGMDFNKTRDKMMYQNFMTIYERLPKGKFYGQFGLNHVFQKKQSDVEWLAALLNGESSPIKGKILSVIYIYKDCKEMMNKDYNIVDITTLKQNEKTIDSFLKSDFTLFKLTGDNSPFQKNLIWPLNEEYVGVIPKNGVTTDYYQFIVVIKNSQATTPLDK